MRVFSYNSSFPNARRREEIIRELSKTSNFYSYEQHKISLGPAGINSEPRRKQIIRKLGI